MLGIKEKKDKVPISDTRKTLDQLHKEKMQYFTDLQEHILPQKQQELIEAKEQLNNLQQQLKENRYMFHSTPGLTPLLFDTENTIKKLTQEIKEIISKKEEYEYHLNTHKILSIYYKKQSVTETKINSDNSILKYIEQSKTIYPDNNSLNLTKTQLFDKYNEIVNDIHLTDSVKLWLNCEICDNSSNFFADECHIMCQECGKVISKSGYYDEYQLSYKELQETTIVSKFPYKKENHFKEWLNQFQAKETPNIPEEVYEAMRKEIKKHKLKPKQVTHARIKQFLKATNYSSYYNHKTYIIQHLTGEIPPSLTPELERQFTIMFKELLIPFMKHVPKNRVNFLSYSYVLHKFCELLELDHLTHLFPYLKARNKLYEQDLMWKPLCEELRWQFIPSV